MKAMIYAGLTTSARSENKATIKHLFDVIEHITGVAEEAIKSPNRQRELVDVRKIIGIFCVRNLGMKTVETARLINRDHASVCHYTNNINDLMKYDKQFKSKYDKVIKGMHDKKLITYGAETVATYLNNLEAEKQISEIKNRIYE